VGTGGLGGDPAGMNCPSVQSVRPLRADVLIVLDASAAMNDDTSDTPCSDGCGASSKWAQTVAAIEKLVGDTEMTVNWGLQLFPDPGTACGAAGGVVVPVGLARAAAIAAAIGERTSPNGGVIAGGDAPMRDALNGATRYLSGLTDAGPKFVVLATAGAPSCPAGGSDAGAGDAVGSVQAIVDAHNAGFPTKVLGIASAGGITATTLDEMAVAGGLPRTGSPRYTPVADATELMGLQTLLGINPACIFAIPPPWTSDGSSSRDNIVVRVNGVEIPQDPRHLDGWDYVNATHASLEIHGPLCDALMSGAVQLVTIVYRCGPIP